MNNGVLLIGWRRCDMRGGTGRNLTIRIGCCHCRCPVCSRISCSRGFSCRARSTHETFQLDSSSPAIDSRRELMETAQLTGRGRY